MANPNRAEIWAAIENLSNAAMAYAEAQLLPPVVVDDRYRKFKRAQEDLYRMACDLENEVEATCR